MVKGEQEEEEVVAICQGHRIRMRLNDLRLVEVTEDNRRCAEVGMGGEFRLLSRDMKTLYKLYCYPVLTSHSWFHLHKPYKKQKDVFILTTTTTVF